MGSVALTFDDGPNPETTLRLLDILDHADAKATFFLSGVNCVAHPDLVASIVGAGHTVYGHGWEHVDLSEDPARALADMRRVEDALSQHRPTPTPYLIRLPYNAGYNLVSIHRAMTLFHPEAQFAWWRLSTKDYTIAERCNTITEQLRECGKAAMAIDVPALEGAIVLMHDLPVATILLPMVLDVISRRALSAVPLAPMEGKYGLRRWILLPVA